MRIFSGLILTIALAYALGAIMPWWSVAIAGFVMGAWIDRAHWKVFLIGTSAIALLWGISAAAHNAMNDGILADRMGALFGGLGAVSLIALTAAVGGFVGGMGALTGSLGRNLIR